MLPLPWPAMCGRYTSTTSRDQLGQLFEALVTDRERAPSYNVTPTSDVYVVLDDGDGRKIDLLRWGFVPAWAKDLKIGGRMINARAESVPTSGAYKSAFKRHRCIIPADGFYEWKKVPGAKAKQPYYLERKDGDPVALAGLWDEWRGPDRKGEPLRTCTIITTAPNATMKPIHDRMPVILPSAAWDQWLDPNNDDTEALGKLLVPAPADLLVARPVSTEVNSTRNDGPELIAAVEPE
jgi:putative SOS response-associated peptidase YedK